MAASAPLLASAVPRVGVAVFILYPTSASAREPSAPAAAALEYKFIMGQRIGSHGAGTWALPGGHLEFGETFEACAAREVLEETGLAVENIKFLTATNDVMPLEPSADASGKVKGRHYVTIFMTAQVKQEGSPDVAASVLELPTPQLLEPQKCAGWEWVTWEEMVRLGNAAGTTAQSTTKGQGEAPRKLFSPLLGLLEQRKGMMPRFDPLNISEYQSILF